MRAMLAMLVLMAGTGASGAACLEGLGCTDSETFSRGSLRRLSCENLYVARNTIYDENGLCFRTAKGREYFDNSDCFVEDPGAVRLNNYERANVSRIREVEKAKGCR